MNGKQEYAKRLAAAHESCQRPVPESVVLSVPIADVTRVKLFDCPVQRNFKPLQVSPPTAVDDTTSTAAAPDAAAPTKAATGDLDLDNRSGSTPSSSSSAADVAAAIAALPFVVQFNDLRASEFLQLRVALRMPDGLSLEERRLAAFLAELLFESDVALPPSSAEDPCCIRMMNK
eukprot:GHVU01084452.1.p2 GENE.GHVU01084452.1~~GHVU01084452.1.p2  ORF type:complete len:175 (-),score=48.08 GHVU01084452.1:130-654(-)